MKIKHVIQFVLLFFCMNHQNVWAPGGLHVDASELDTRPSVNGDTVAREKTLEEEYQEQQRLLKQEALEEYGNDNQGATPPTKPSLSKILPSTDPTASLPVEVAPENTGMQDLTDEDKTAIEKAGEELKTFSLRNCDSHNIHNKTREPATDLQRKMIILKVLFEKELLKKDHSLSEGEVKSLLSELQKTIDTLQETSGDEEEEKTPGYELKKLRTLRKKMNELLRDPKEELFKAAKENLKERIEAMKENGSNPKTTAAANALERAVNSLKNETPEAQSANIKIIEKLTEDLFLGKPEGKTFFGRKTNKWSSKQNKTAQDALDKATLSLELAAKPTPISKPANSVDDLKEMFTSKLLDTKTKTVLKHLQRISINPKLEKWAETKINETMSDLTSQLKSITDHAKGKKLSKVAKLLVQNAVNNANTIVLSLEISGMSQT